MVWLIVMAVLVVALLAVAVRLRSRSPAAAVTPPPMRVESPPPRPAAMTALESALAEVTDREGRPVGGRIDADASRPDDVDTSDDGRPLLRRALDDVERRDAERHDVEQHEVERHDVEQHEVERHDVEQHEVERHDVEQHGSQPGAASSEPI